MSDQSFFTEFKLEVIETRRGKIRVRSHGDGPALLLLHGNPQTHVIWHLVAPTLASDYTVICPDLCGYGQSFKPPCSEDHAAYAKKEMAVDMVDLMRLMGHDSFYLAGHDRGARVSHRLALDYPEKVAKLALLDIVPTIEHFEQADMSFAMGYYHWFWLAQPHPVPESVITAAPESWFTGHTSREQKRSDFFHPQALEDYLDCVKNPEMIRGMCEDYRAAATIDLEHDRASREEGIKINCPLLALWGAKGKIGKWYEPIEIWESYCHQDVTGGPLDSGHYLAEEVPDQLIQLFRSFFK